MAEDSWVFLAFWKDKNAEFALYITLIECFR